MRRVVLIDDEGWTLEGLEKIFNWSEHGYEVAGKFDDAVEAMNFLLSDAPDLALVDIRMPEIMGIDMINMAYKRGIPTKFVVVSAYSDFEYARGAMKAGALDYLVKPISYEDAENLLNRLDEYFNAMHWNPAQYSVAETSNAQFNQLLKYIRAHFSERIQLKELAQQFFLNSSYCSEMFNHILGISFSAYVNQLRIEHGKFLLDCTSQTIDDIAVQVGFYDTAHFSRNFKNLVGQTPKQYRSRKRTAEERNRDAAE